jgi:hypothetical protein
MLDIANTELCEIRSRELGTTGFDALGFESIYQRLIRRWGMIEAVADKYRQVGWHFSHLGKRTLIEVVSLGSKWVFKC